jgi:hypothetical protein
MSEALVHTITQYDVLLENTFLSLKDRLAIMQEKTA